MYIFVFILILYKMPPRSSETVQWWEKRKKIVQRWIHVSYNAMCRAWNMYVQKVRLELRFIYNFLKVDSNVTFPRPSSNRKKLFYESKMIKYLSPELVGTPHLKQTSTRKKNYKPHQIPKRTKKKHENSGYDIIRNKIKKKRNNKKIQYTTCY